MAHYEAQFLKVAFRQTLPGSHDFLGTVLGNLYEIFGQGHWRR